jgi:hypothetical protein
MWAHGFRGPALELTVDNHPLRAFLIANGYAWAASSFSRNDYDVAQGVKDTHALTELFNGIAGRPDLVYLTGASMGGHVTVAAIEQYPQEYAGAMPVCGVLGDLSCSTSTSTTTWSRPLAGVPTTFPGSSRRRKPCPDHRHARGGVAERADHRRPAPQVLTEPVRSERPLFDAAWVAGIVPVQFGSLDGTAAIAGVVVDNTERCTSSTPIGDQPGRAGARDAVLRVAQEPADGSSTVWPSVPVVNGTPPVPVLTLRTIGDLFVPFSIGADLRDQGGATAASDLLVQRAIGKASGTDFLAAELVRGFTDLVRWVEGGFDHPATRSSIPRWWPTRTTVARSPRPPGTSAHSPPLPVTASMYRTADLHGETGAMDAWVAEWHEHVYPLRRELGFTVPSAWTVPARTCSLVPSTRRPRLPRPRIRAQPRLRPQRRALDLTRPEAPYRDRAPGRCSGHVGATPRGRTD